MLSATSQLLVRSRERFVGRWLIVNPQDPHVFAELANSDNDLHGFHHYYDIYQQANQGNEDKHTFAAAFASDQAFDGIVIHMPKAKAQAQMLIANMVANIKAGGQLLLVGENKGGVKSAPKLLADYAPTCVKLDSARHCALYGAQIDSPVRQFNISEWEKHKTIQINGQSLKVCFLPGVFSAGSLDPATELLLNQVSEVPNGPVLDFGCGAGIIGSYLGKLNSKAKVVMSDISALALYCSTKTAELNQVKAEIIASNGLTDISGHFSAVYTNPPFHTGLATDYAITERFISLVSNIMKPKAELTLVANSFLKYPPLLEQAFKQQQVLAETTKFRVYRCS